MDMDFRTEPGIGLVKYLQDYITEKTYFSIMEQILETLEKARQQGMQVVLDMQTMSVQGGRVRFQVLMEDSVYEGETIKRFLMELTFQCVFDKEESCQRVTAFLHYLDRNPAGFSLAGARAYCAGQPPVSPVQMPQQTVQPQVPPIQTQQPVQLRYPQEPADGETGVLDPAYWEKLQMQDSRQVSWNDETGVLDASFWESAMGGVAGGGAVEYARLCSTKTGEVIPITKQDFWIGKEDVDLLINKDVISRKHAVILCRDGHCFISDNGSMNKTYVNNREIPPKASVEIQSGARLKFANEEYEFQM